MNILFLIDDISELGGTERVTAKVSSLLSADHQVEICSLHQVGQPQFEIHKSIFLNSLNTEKKTFSQLLLAAGIKLRKYIRSKQIDLVICSDSQLAPIAIIATVFTSIKTIVWEHFNSQIETTFGSRWFGRRLAAFFCNGIVTLTLEDKNSWEQKYTVRAKITTIPNPSSIQHKQDTLISHERSNIVLAAGRFTDQKGFDLLIQAWHQIPETIRTDWKLKITGPKGSASIKIENLIKQYGLYKQVILPGQNNDMETEYRNASFFVSSSRYEGFGLTIIEAMNCGLPVIAFDCPMGPGEILQQEYGLLVPKEDTDLLAKAMLKLMTTTQLRNKLTQKSLVRAKDFSDEKISYYWQELVEGIN